MSDHPTTLRHDSIATLGDGTTALAAPLVEEPAAVESLEVTELWRRCEVADREVNALRQLLAQGRPVTDADLARVQGLIRGEARGVWLGRPPTDEEVAAHVREHGEDAVLVVACDDGVVWVASATGLLPFTPGAAKPNRVIVDAALPIGDKQAWEWAEARVEMEKAKRP